MRRTLAFSLLFGLGVTAAVADTAGSCSIRAGRTEEKCRSPGNAEIAPRNTGATRVARICFGANGAV